ncbi:MAG: DUF2244 domain-containing protein [Alphaproteobacteria bacterium]|nr:DUF2244 domain-containing protein [Alphaproteobacteria bacterium]MDX5417191.1 DUF2244 domain-containing protein [Alphaproteobacteria bacterium]MDX5494628.1 DUF2244 domain-containing protein [Alphaproteobacteria bacterium]
MPDESRTAEPLPPPLHFDAVILPHRSLSMRGFAILIGVVAAVNFTAGAYFMARGAWPVLGFCGLEVLAVWWAFRANYRAARAHETVQLSDDELLIRRVDAKGRAEAVSLKPYWVRLALSKLPDESTRLHVVSHGREVELASQLSPAERADFARALAAALAKLKETPAPQTA